MAYLKMFVFDFNCKIYCQFLVLVNFSIFRAMSGIGCQFRHSIRCSRWLKIRRMPVSELVLSMSRATSFSGSSLTKFLHSKVKCPEYPHFLQPSLGAEPWPGPPGALEAPNILSENRHINAFILD